MQQQYLALLVLRARDGSAVRGWSTTSRTFEGRDGAPTYLKLDLADVPTHDVARHFVAACAFVALTQCCAYAPLSASLTRAEYSFEFEDLPAGALVTQGPRQGIAAQECARDLSVPIHALEQLQGEPPGLFEISGATAAPLKP